MNKTDKMSFICIVTKIKEHFIFYPNQLNTEKQFPNNKEEWVIELSKGSICKEYMLVEHLKKY